MPDLNLTFTIKRQVLVDLLVTAVEGGSNYWAGFSNISPNGESYDRVRVTDFEDNSKDRGEFSADDLLVGLQRLAADPPPFESALKHLTDVIREDYDADTADVVLQMSIFGEVVYG